MFQKNEERFEPIVLQVQDEFAISKPPSLPLTGSNIGAKVAFRGSILYAIFVAIMIFTFEIGEVGYFQGELLLSFYAGFYSLIFGGVPAYIVGTLGGWLVGAWFTLVRAPLSFVGALAIGFLTWIVILLFPTAIITLEVMDALAQQREVDWLFLALSWYLPCLFALSGLGWVAHRLNLFIADSSPGPYP